MLQYLQFSYVCLLAIFFFQISNEMLKRIEELDTKVRTPQSEEVEKEYCENLMDLRLLVSKEYCVMLIGL